MDDQDIPLKIQYLKLKRINELNRKLKQELARDRITASNACLSIIDFATSHKDYAIPEIWGHPMPGSNPHRINNPNLHRRAQRGSSSDSSCCVIM
ncbi:LANO_0G07096g1_1 [Lachancea nothofagi CBS 11611]|uniref:Guanine nucleotide-binding protein subunit gamma n=1 Tax=Lachancea nothofagi CBS 11611 TaxID=1266666 RepID=A0A1G4KHN8_9SACH|nr:LANO_0G07096g1_1 [Lachancea nothofagi CBS 11611]